MSLASCSSFEIMAKMKDSVNMHVDYFVMCFVAYTLPCLKTSNVNRGRGGTPNVASWRRKGARSTGGPFV